MVGQGDLQTTPGLFEQGVAIKLPPKVEPALEAQYGRITCKAQVGVTNGLMQLLEVVRMNLGHTQSPFALEKGKGDPKFVRKKGEERGTSV